MSQWTHVNGNIRFDALRLTPNEDRKRLELLMGKTCSCEDAESKWDECTVPCGSEGSLCYKIYENPNESAMYAFSVSIWGDLRDYKDLEAIKKWFKNLLTAWMGIRSAVLEVEVERQKTVILIPLWNEDEYKVIDVKEILIKGE